MFVDILQDDPPIRSINLHTLQHVKVGIRPVHPVRYLIDGDAIGPPQVVLNNGPTISSIQAHADNLGPAAPVGEDEQFLCHMDGHAARLLHGRRDNGAHGAVEFADADPLPARVTKRRIF